jgi:two-component system sensor histidine kinase VicK
MFLRSLQWRLVFIFILITIFLAIPIGLLLNKQVEMSSYDNFKKGIDRGFANWDIKSGSTYEQMEKSLNEYNEAIILFNIVGEYKSYSIIRKSDMKVMFSSDIVYYNEGEGGFINEILDSRNFLSVMEGNESGESRRLVRTDERSFFDYARLVKLSDGDYILYFRHDSGEWREMTQRFNDIIISSLILAAVFSLVVGYLLSRTITSPIKGITHKAESIAAGDFGQMLDVKSQDEIGKLAGSFNYMSKSLKDTLAEISSEKNKIETILNYMTDGVVAFNVKGEVIHVNPAAVNMTSVERIEGGTFNSYAEKFGLDFTIDELLNLDSYKTKETVINAGGKSIRVYFAVFADENKKPEGIIAVLQDITEQEKLENMRREFVANVSHELRTPLTSIKSYAETLLDGALEDRETAGKFLGVINSEVDRMTRLVKDLLQLSSLDNKRMRLDIKRNSISTLIRKVCDKMEMEAQSKDQSLECTIEEGLPDMSFDYDRIEQVVLNILSNAIKYTLKGGKISVFLSRAGSEAEIRVADTGIGIPGEDLPRIFERFYRVDKARSREMGGTGLGLSIAKEIVEVHNGRITIKSELDKGTEVAIYLPFDV